MEKLNVGGYPVQVEKFKGRESVKIEYFLTSKILPVLPKLFGSLDMSGGASVGNILKAGIKFDQLACGVSSLFNALGDEDKALDFMQRILATTTVYGKDTKGRIFRLSDDVDFDEFFVGRVELVYQICFEVLKLNYPFFLNRVTSLFKSTSQTNSFDQQEENKESLKKDSAQPENSEKELKESGDIGDSFLEKFVQNQK